MLLAPEFIEARPLEAEYFYKKLEKDLENQGFSLIRTSSEYFPWVIKTPSKRELTHEELRKFYQNCKLEFGNKKHIENIKALEYLEALQYLYDDVNEDVF